MTFGNQVPKIGKEVFVAPNAHVIGDVSIGENSSIWYNVVVRGDVNSIKIGQGTNLQDRVIVHVSSRKGHERGTDIGDNVTVGKKKLLF